ncbi:MAG: chorismate mutase [Oscillospiraceae bacterium]|nr:chorismate mutase [Oscillospiraceae bacterium]
MIPENCTDKLNEIDRQLLRLFRERMAVSRKIAGCKISDGIPFADTESELRGETNYENRFFKAVDEIANDYELDFSPEHDIPQPSGLPKFTKDTKVGFQGG